MIKVSIKEYPKMILKKQILSRFKAVPMIYVYIAYYCWGHLIYSDYFIIAPKQNGVSLRRFSFRISVVEGPQQLNKMNYCYQKRVMVLFFFLNL